MSMRALSTCLASVFQWLKQKRETSRTKRHATRIRKAPPV